MRRAAQVQEFRCRLKDRHDIGIRLQRTIKIGRFFCDIGNVELIRRRDQPLRQTAEFLRVLTIQDIDQPLNLCSDVQSGIDRKLLTELFFKFSLLDCFYKSFQQ